MDKAAGQGKVDASDASPRGETALTVSLDLPRAAAPAAAENAASEVVRSAEGSGRTVLLVEDQQEVREVMELFLDELGYRVVTAPDAVAARELLEHGQAVDLLLTDVVMPKGISGIDLALAARRRRRDLKVLLVSGYPRDLDGQADAIPDEFVFLAKPFRQEELAAAIDAALNGGGRTAPRHGETGG